MPAFEPHPAAGVKARIVLHICRLAVFIGEVFRMKKAFASIFWLLFAFLGAWAYAVIAFKRGEPVNSAYLLIAAVCTYAISYRFYSRWIALRVLVLDNRRAT